MRINKDFDLTKEAKEYTIRTLKDIKQDNIYLSGKDKVMELAEVLLDLGDTRFCYNVDIEDGFGFIANNALDVQDIYQDLADTEEVEINPFKDLDDCVYHIFRFAVEKVLQDSEYILEECDEEEICLSEDLIGQIIEELEVNSERDMDFER